ncbi:hypothetical protein LTR17_005466 [Elasticomyces elasticus]|nr:hypothetical protein LTR17_005466 [Elasticomyces elasticus]
MPTITSRLAWALEVDPAEVMARVREEAKHRLTADTLRLCNVYGRGDKATITKLPKELIDLIEECLNDEKFAAAACAVDLAKHAQRCFRGYCSPYRNHSSDEQKLDMVNREFHNRGLPAAKSLCEEFVDEVAEWIVANEFDREDPTSWQPEHEKNVEEWRGLVGTFGDGQQDVPTEEANFILRYYDLELCIGHQNHGWGTYDTAMYLTLPDTNGQRYDEVLVDDCGTPYDYKGRGGDPSEEGFIAYDVTVPSAQSASQRAQFGKMLAKLGVPLVESARSDQEREQQRMRAEPKLMMLAKVLRRE